MVAKIFLKITLIVKVHVEGTEELEQHRKVDVARERVLPCTDRIIRLLSHMSLSDMGPNAGAHLLPEADAGGSQVQPTVGQGIRPGLGTCPMQQPSCIRPHPNMPGLGSF